MENLDNPRLVHDTDRIALANRFAQLTEAYALEVGKWSARVLGQVLAADAHLLDQHARAALTSAPIDVLDAYATAAEKRLRRITGARKLIENIEHGWKQ